MRNVLSKKLKNRRGFTLAELLIVVAIIAVLMAIMIPVFGASKERAILARDAANLRSVYAEKLMGKMAETPGGEVSFTIKKTEDLTSKGIEFESEASGGSPKGTAITVKRGSLSETIYVDDDVTVTLEGFS